MKKVKNKRGGARPGAGAKPKADKKVPLFIYPLSSRVNMVGVQKAKELAEQAIENYFENTLK